MSNANVKLTPDTVTVDEYADFSTTVSIEFTPPEDDPSATYNYVLHTVNIDSSIPVVFTKLSSMSFSLTGSLIDMFDRTLKYVNEDLSYGEVHRFADLPSTYAAMYSYTPPSEPQKIFTFNVVMRPNGTPVNTLSLNQFDIYPLTFKVNNNFTVSNAKFVNYVKGGTWAKGVK